MPATATPPITTVHAPLRLRVGAAVVAAGTIAAGTFALTFGAGDRIDVAGTAAPSSAVSRYDDLQANKARATLALGARSLQGDPAPAPPLRDLELNKRHNMRALGMQADAE